MRRRRPTLRLVSFKTSHHFQSQFQSTRLPVYTVESSRHFNFSPPMHILFLRFRKHAMVQPCIWLRINSVNYYPPKFFLKFFFYNYFNFNFTFVSLFFFEIKSFKVTCKDPSYFNLRASAKINSNKLHWFYPYYVSQRFFFGGQGFIILWICFSKK